MNIMQKMLHSCVSYKNIPNIIKDKQNITLFF